jgi:hypothetical protein
MSKPMVSAAVARPSVPEIIVGHDDQPFLAVVEGEFAEIIVGHEDVPFVAVVEGEFAESIVGHEDVPYIVASMGSSDVEFFVDDGDDDSRDG